MGHSTEGHNHGMIEIQCPTCAGKGQVITPRAVVRDDGSVDTWESADICSGCGGSGTVWI